MRAPSDRRVRLLTIGHGDAATGFSRVLHGIIAHLPARYDVHHLAVNHRADQPSAPWPIYGNPRAGDVHALERAAELCEALRPDVALILGDLWFCGLQIGRLKQLAGRPICVAYCPVDGELRGARYVEALADFDQLVLYNHFGRRELARFERETQAQNRAFSFGPLAVIPHGVDTSVFRPLFRGGMAPSDRRAAKMRLFGAESELADSFIVFNGSKHQPRKRLDLTIEGFARFARDKPASVRLYLHAASRGQGPDLRLLAQRWGIADRLILTEGCERGHPAVASERLNLIYNACDVGINTSTGEGWGLVSFEHAATGAPQIVPRHSACAELWEGAAVLIEPAATQHHAALGMLRHVVAPQDVAGALERLYADHAFRARMASAAFARATGPRSDWGRIAAQWNRLLRRAWQDRAHAVS
jgi:glycosyltransferase involved in cell wall biosynthesis